MKMKVLLEVQAGLLMWMCGSIRILVNLNVVQAVMRKSLSATGAKARLQKEARNFYLHPCNAALWQYNPRGEWG